MKRWNEAQSRRDPGKPRKPSKPRLSEAQVLRACLAVLEAHPLVAFAFRQNTGGVEFPTVGGRRRFVKFSFRGCSDILGMLRGGRFLACECKATGKSASVDQEAFLQRVTAGGGMALCVDDPVELWQALEAWRKANGLAML